MRKVELTLVKGIPQLSTISKVEGFADGVCMKWTSPSSSGALNAMTSIGRFGLDSVARTQPRSKFD